MFRLNLLNTNQEIFLSPDSKGNTVWMYDTSQGKRYRISFPSKDKTLGGFSAETNIPVEMSVNGKKISLIAAEALEIRRRIDELYGLPKTKPSFFCIQYEKSKERSSSDLGVQHARKRWERLIKRMERTGQRMERAERRMAHREKREEFCTWLDHIAACKE